MKKIVKNEIKQCIKMLEMWAYSNAQMSAKTQHDIRAQVNSALEKLEKA